MRRVLDPLARMGARIDASAGGTAPLRIAPATGGLHGIDYESPVASAQVKSCVLLAGLRAAGRTRVAEPHPTRDHTERMLEAFGWPVERLFVQRDVRAIFLHRQRAILDAFGAPATGPFDVRFA